MTKSAQTLVRSAIAALAVVACLPVDTRALTLELSDRDVERALKIAGDTDAARGRFHAPYVTRVNDATVEQIDTITEFRRYVLVTEERLRLGDWMFARGVRAARDAVRSYRGRVSLVARLRFHPQNTFANIPSSECVIGAASGTQPAVAPLDVIRTRIDQPQTGVRRGRSAPLIGALIDTVFDAASIGDTTRPISVLMNGQVIARLTIDFSRLE